MKRYLFADKLSTVSVTSNKGRDLVHSINTLLAVILLIHLCSVRSIAQHDNKKAAYTRTDTLRGTLNSNRDWWDVQHYGLVVKPFIQEKKIEGITSIQFSTAISGDRTLQLDLQAPLIIDSVFYNTIPVQFRKEDVNAWLCELKNVRPSTDHLLVIYYHGIPREAVNPPWDGGWVWRTDEKGNPFVSIAVQGTGASAWYPCKDHQSDKPDKGTSIKTIVPNGLVAVSNGRNTKKEALAGNLTAYTWEVKNPINNYNIVTYIGKYVNFTEQYTGEKGKLDLSYWVLDYNLKKAKKQFKQAKLMLKAFEYWFGPYPFYEDSYKLVEAPFLGMEHQSGVAYGNRYKNGYLGSDYSGSGWGDKFDYILVHESGHEWFANNITTKDIADLWVHESFTTYSETAFVEYFFGKEAANEYNLGQRKGIKNNSPMIGDYGVNKQGSGDMYVKGSNMIHTIRHSMNDDEKFRSMLRGLTSTFYHQTVTTEQIEQYVINDAGFNYQRVFDQYLRTTVIPVFEYQFNAATSTLKFHYTSCINGFNLPIHVDGQKVFPTEDWQSIKLKESFHPEAIEKAYLLKLKAVAIQ